MPEIIKEYINDKMSDYVTNEEQYKQIKISITNISTWNEYLFAALLTSTNAKTLPVMVASQTGSQGINWWSMAALSGASIAPLVVVCVFLEKYIVKGMAAGAIKG